MFRVGLIGPESCGKSTVGRYLSRRYDFVTYVDEYERTYFEQIGRPATSATREEVEAIAREQLRRQQQTEGEVVVFDSDLMMIRLWLDIVWGTHPDWLEEGIRDYGMDTYLLFYPDLPWKNDPTRSHGSDEERVALFGQYEHAIQQLNIPYYIVRTRAYA